MAPDTKSEITKHLLAKALKELMEERTIDKISIEDITSQAGFRRQTFYYHFGDVYSLLVWTFTDDISRYLSRKKSIDTWDGSVLAILEYLEDNRAFCLSAYQSIGSDAIKDLIAVEVDRITREIIDKEMKDLNLSEKAVEFITTFSTGGVANLVEGWLKGTLSLTKEDIINYTMKISDIVRVGLIMLPENTESKKIIPVESE